MYPMPSAVGSLRRSYDTKQARPSGQQQRVAIARALVQQAEVILADGPIASLDPQTSADSSLRISQ
jgi:phosphonate transport system ATP-binding protein